MVAKKFISGRESAHEYLSSHGDYAAVNTGHALEECKDLLQLMSNEARAVLAEVTNTIAEYEDAEQYDAAHRVTGDYWLLWNVFHRLGLELDEEGS